MDLHRRGRRPKTRGGVDVADRHRNMVRLKEYDRSQYDSEEPSMTIAATPDDGTTTSLKRRSQKTVNGSGNEVDTLSIIHQKQCSNIRRINQNSFEQVQNC